MNIQFQICGLCILLLMILFYNSHKNLHLYKEQVCFQVLCIMTTSLILDILSIISIKLRFDLPPLLVTFLCKTYIVTLVWLLWSALIYIIADLIPPQMHRRITFRSSLITALQSIVIYFLPIYIFDNGSVVHT